MTEINLKLGDLTPGEQEIITAGFVRHTNECQAPHFKKERINWLASDSAGKLVGALTADLLWDWIYIDELWVHESHRAQGLGKRLMEEAEDYAKYHKLSGLWLWTQSWQAAGFYKRLGYVEFAHFADFPKGHSRVGFRKAISTAGAGTACGSQ